MMIYNNVYELIGNTPVVKINDLLTNTDAEVYLKLEWYNPGGSVKDRIALNMIDVAEKEGILKKGDTIIEPTSGNTGIGIAMIAAAKGYKAILTMPDSLSIERRTILKGYGAELILTEAAKGMKESIRVAQDLVEKHGYFMPMQFKNLNNPKAHMKYTALEIIKDIPDLDYFVAAVGTGGTITGVGTILKEYNDKISIKAVEPKNSAVLSGNPPGKHMIQGIGAGFIPEVLDTTIYDEVIQVSNDEAFETARILASKLGLLVGISTGANVFAALKVAREVGNGKKVLTVSPSNGERYLSTELYNY
ncbi:cysteine synthase A [Candidatus Izimaplasma bacterium]|nr:cysteine synthase A [Candidatus Izimaplasma bacterium]